LGIPDTQYVSVITFSSNEFTRICRELYQLSETVTVETNKSYIKFSVSGDSVGGSIRIDSNNSDEVDENTVIHVDEPVNLAFALRYLNMFTKASSLSQQVI
jgi:proliferating cell nuclear antigen